MRVFIALMIVGLTGCVPPFSEMQSAATLGSDKNEITVFTSRVDWEDPDDSGHLQNHIGVLGGVGLTPWLDVRARWERIQVEGVDEAEEVIALGPKLALIPEKLAIYLPVGFQIQSNIYWELHPSLIGSVAITPWLELTASGKALIFLSSDSDPWYAANLGAGLGNFSKWVIRPEVGVLTQPGSDNRYYHVSLGVSLRRIGG
ncbi:MAG: hypothetical protein K9N34_09740 [Candidatus Marinimicrobia bacterium]|nr:hypothetical protein [Candidatus Neomarinimicrobiota bacterium]MCF7839617.1 hypothetical protein [Candidatus Neomarinimicrobiota bacterium]MCF7902802.1 hypothetical protein [Candidatus Neomarinimicrobiota bacterium]